MNTTSTTQNTTAYTAVESAHRELVRYQARTGSDWARDGYGIATAQAVVDAAQREYNAAFAAYIAATALSNG